MSNSNPSGNWQALDKSIEFPVHNLVTGSDGAVYALWYDEHGSQKYGIDKWDATQQTWTTIYTWGHELQPWKKALSVDNAGNIYLLLRNVSGGAMVLYKGDSNGAWNTIGDAAPHNMAVDGQGNIYGIGWLDYSQYNGAPYSGIFKYGTGWEMVGDADYSMYSAQDMVIDSRNNIYGLFVPQYADPDFTRVFILKYDAQSSVWTRLGTTGPLPNDNAGGFRLTLDQDETTLYIAGDFTEIIPEAGDSVRANGVAKWDGTAWSPLGGGSGLKYIYAIASGANGAVYITGRPWDSTAMWDGNTWTSMHLTGMANSIVTDAKGNVYAGGDFRLLDNSNMFLAKNIAMYTPILTDDANG